MVTGTEIIARARSYIGKLEDGPDVPRIAREVGKTFPEFAEYVKEANNNTPWCGIFIAYVLSQFGIKPPPTRNGVGFMWVDTWAKWGEPVPVNQSRPGDVAIWLGGPHHVSFVGGNGRYVGGNQGNRVTEGSYRTPDYVRRVAQAQPSEDKVPGRQYNITATVFGGESDPNTSAYDGHMISDTELGVALPYRFKGARPKVRVIKDGKSVVCNLVDVGPWNIDDPYWAKETRPQAESGSDATGRRTNSAGIDLTPAAAKAIGLDGKGLVDWEFVQTPEKTPEPTSKTIDEALARIDAAVADIRELSRVTQQPQPQLDLAKLIQPLLAELAPKVIPLLLPYLPQLMPYLLDAMFKPRQQSIMDKPGVKAGAVGGIGAVIGGLITAFLTGKVPQ